MAAYEDIGFEGKKVLVCERERKNRILVNISYGHSSERAGEGIKCNRFKYVKKLDFVVILYLCPTWYFLFI